MKNIDNFTVYIADPAREKEGCEIACRIGADIVRGSDGLRDDMTFLRLDGDGAALCGGGMEVRGDIAKTARRVRPQNLGGELLVRAAKPKSFGDFPTALDATAGLGEDSFLLAASGFHVTLCERDPIIACLLRDMLRRASETAELAEIAARMEFIECDSVGYMRSLQTAPDVIFLDPMFPERRKSGLIKKKLQLIGRLEQPCDDEAALLSAAVELSPAKIIIKRPAKGAYLAGVKPDYSITGRAVRYDCVVPPRKADL